MGLRCGTCGADLERTEVGTVTVQQTFNSKPPTRSTTCRHGTINWPCGCIEGGVVFDFTEPPSHPLRRVET